LGIERKTILSNALRRGETGTLLAMNIVLTR
jgi:hypothetical protein